MSSARPAAARPPAEIRDGIGEIDIGPAAKIGGQRAGRRGARRRKRASSCSVATTWRGSSRDRVAMGSSGRAGPVSRRLSHCSKIASNAAVRLRRRRECARLGRCRLRPRSCEMIVWQKPWMVVVVSSSSLAAAADKRASLDGIQPLGQGQATAARERVQRGVRRRSGGRARQARSPPVR